MAGSRRGQRQQFAIGARVRFGRHPDSEVRFDAHRDLDASSRHAELRQGGDRLVLCDTGSSNGTWVDGERVAEFVLAIGEPVVVEFGDGGPKLRLFAGDDAGVAALPKVPRERDPDRRGPSRPLAIALAVGAATGIIVWWIW